MTVRRASSVLETKDASQHDTMPLEWKWPGFSAHVCLRSVGDHVDLEEVMDHTYHTPDVVNPEEVARKLRTDYAHGIKDHMSKALEEICELGWRLERSDIQTQDFLAAITDLISRRFGITSVSIAIWDPVDKLYHYKAVNGIDKEAVESYLRIAYTKAQIDDNSTYPCHEISSHTKIYLTEEHPYAPGEESSYRRPGLIGMKRRALTESLEADYVDCYFYGRDKEILGWIEASGTRLRKLPDAVTIRWMELIAIIVGQALQVKK
jgi:hypothetical protein